MLINDSFAFIPLIAVFATAVFLFILLIIAKKSNTNKVSVSLFISLVVVLLGIIFTIAKPSLFTLSLVLLLENILLIPHFISLRNSNEFEEAEIHVDGIDGIIEAETQIQEELENDKSEENEIISLLDTSKDFIMQAANAFSEEAGLSRLLDFINTGLMKEIKADGGAILLVDDFDDVLAVKSFSGDFPPPYKLPEDVPHKIVRVETNFRFAQFTLDENIFGEVAKTGIPELITDCANDSRIYENTPEEFLKCGSYIVIPMKFNDTVIGVAALSRKFESTPFSTEDFRVAQILTSFACAAIKSVYSFQEVVEHSELTREAEIAVKLQKTLHPKLLPSIPGLILGYFHETAEGVCGDYYDVLPSRKDRISFILADVAGKGMNSLIIMVMIRAILRLIVNTTQSAGTILGWANRGIAIEHNIDHFASVALINYDSVTKKIQYATAGTTPILHYNSVTGETKSITKVSEPIGVEKTTVYADNELDVNTGDIIVMYSDGVAESVNSAGKQYSSDRLINIITEKKDLSGKEIANFVKADVKKFSGTAHQHDDQTLLVIKIQ